MQCGQQGCNKVDGQDASGRQGSSHGQPPLASWKGGQSCSQPPNHEIMFECLLWRGGLFYIFKYLIELKSFVKVLLWRGGLLSDVPHVRWGSQWGVPQVSIFFFFRISEHPLEISEYPLEMYE